MTTINFTLPLTAGGGAAFPLLNVTEITMTNASYTAQQTDLASILQIIQGTLTSPQNILYPVGVNGLAFLVANTTAQTITVMPASGSGSGCPIAAGTSSWVWSDGTNWNRGQELGSGSLTPPAGTGIAHVAGGAFVTPAAPINLASNGSGGDVSGALGSANGGTGLTTVGTANQVLGTVDGATISWVSLTSNMVGPAFSASLSQTGGSLLTLITGATYTPAGLTATPAASSAGITAATIQDNQGHGPTSILGDSNPLSPPVASYTITTAGTEVLITVSETKGGVTSSPSVGAIWYDRCYSGLSAGGTATGVAIQAAPATTATLAGGTAGGLVMSGTGGLASPVGQTFTITPSSSMYWWFMCPHTATAHVFQDANNAYFPFGMTRTLTAITVTNENGVVQTSYWDIYVSTNPLIGTYKPYVQS